MKSLAIKAAVFFLVLALAGRTASAIDNCDVVVIAGQSNAVGYGLGPGVDPSSDPRVWQWEFDGTVALATNPLSGPQVMPGRFGSGLHFGIGYANTRLASRRKVLLVPTAVGGTGFSGGDWLVGGPEYVQAIQLATAAVSSGKGNKVVALLWQQGEQDAEAALDPATYQADLIALIRGFRASIPTAGPTTPFIMGGMVPEWMSTIGEPAYDIATVHASIPAIEPYCAYVGGSWGMNNGGTDIIHYNAVGQANLADRYLDGLSFVGPVPTSTPLQIAALRGSDNALWIKTHNGKRWSYWSPLGGTLPAEPAVVRSASGRWDILALGFDNLLWARSLASANGNWTAWKSFGPPALNLTFTGRPTAASTAASPDRVDVAVLGADQSLWTINRQGDAWSGWTQLPGASPSSPSFLAMAGGGAWLLARGHVGGAWFDAITSAGLWSDWTALGGAPAAEVDGALAPSGNVDVFTITTTGALSTARVINGAAGIWSNLGGTVLGSYVWPVAGSNGSLSVLTLGATNTVNSRTRTTETGSWGKWVQAGAGNVLAQAPTVVLDPAGNLWVFGLNTSGSFSSLERTGQTWGHWTGSN